MRFMWSLRISRPCAPPASTVVAIAIVLGFTAPGQASIIFNGSSLSFGGTNLPGACTDTTCQDATTFGTSSVLIDGGALTLSENQVADGPNAEWDEWSISTVSGGPLAGDINGDWEITMNYDLSAPVDFDQVVNQWTVNGTPVSPLSSIGGICCATASNPSPISGEAFYNSGFSAPLAAGVQSGWNQIFVDPYNFVSSGGVDPSTANGFNFALHFTLENPVPEPGSLGMLAGALVVVPFLRRRRVVR